MSANCVSVSWADHLTFGAGDGRLATAEALERRVDAWQSELDADALHWRALRTRIASSCQAAPGRQHPTERVAREVDWDDLAIVPQIVHASGMRAWLYVSIFDEGWRLPAEAERQHSNHNAMHGQHVAWQSDFTRDHPEYLVQDVNGDPQGGVPCLAYAAVRDHYVARFRGLVEAACWDGLFLCLRSQSRPPEFADQFGYNEPIAAQFEARAGRDLRELARECDPELLQIWHRWDPARVLWK